MALLPITNVTELQAMDFTSDDYYLANDIDASATITWNAGAGFIPVMGNASPRYFDGRGHTIKGLYINRPTEDYIGLFSWCPDTKDVLLENININGRRWVGGLSGVIDITVSIDKCIIISGSVVGSGSPWMGITGGLVSWNDGIINECGVRSGCSVTNIWNVVDKYTGGLVGYNNGTITKSYSKANVHTPTIFGAYMGGLAGWNAVGAVITDCYSMGNVTIDWSTGGVLASDGGFVGRNHGTINRCYSTGLVTPVQGTQSGVCGFVGDNLVGGSILASYWDTETSGYTIGVEPSADPPTGKTSVQMKQEATFAGWDFDTVWRISEGISYPKFVWEEQKEYLRLNSLVNQQVSQNSTINQQIALSSLIELED